MFERSSDDHRLITSILPKGAALPALKALKEHFGIITANINYARGVGRITPLGHRGVGEQPEKEILSAVVSSDMAEMIFEFIYAETHIDHPHGGILYLSDLRAATAYALPAVPEEA
jgi:hypothetical protein